VRRRRALGVHVEGEQGGREEAAEDMGSDCRDDVAVALCSVLRIGRVIGRLLICLYTFLSSECMIMIDAPITKISIFSSSSHIVEILSRGL
jgi:hypothetical protein